MANDVTTTIIAGSMSLIGTFGSVWLNHSLAKRRQEPAPTATGTASAGPRPFEGHSSSGGWLVPLATLLFAIAAGYLQQNLRNTGSDGLGFDPMGAINSLSLAVIILAVALLWWRARPRGAGFGAFLLDMLILSGGFVAGCSVSDAAFQNDLLLLGTMMFATFAVIGGLIFLLVGLFRRTPGPVSRI